MRSALLTINLLLNTYQVRKAGILIERLTDRMPQLLRSEDEEYEEPEDREDREEESSPDTSTGTLSDEETGHNPHYADAARWMFDLYRTRWNVLSGKNFQIATWDVS